MRRQQLGPGSNTYQPNRKDLGNFAGSGQVTKGGGTPATQGVRNNGANVGPGTQREKQNDRPGWDTANLNYGGTKKDGN
jgi:hypothetical protein